MGKSNRKKTDASGLRIEAVYRFLLCVLPLALVFSYWPVIKLGESESMNFELSLPILWLVGFDIVAVVAMWKRGVLWKGLKGKWGWVLFPVWVSLSVLWSLNMTRGLLTMGLMWLLYIAGYGMWQMRGVMDASWRKRWWKWFFGAGLFACGWCLLQCILDVFGVPREYTLLCEGCTYRMFGFPHPNGFAIEPQFMGNLLLAPAVVAAWISIWKQNNIGLSSKFLLFCFFVVTATLFLTFSRGAIYAFAVAMIFMSALLVVKEGAKRRKVVLKKIGRMWLIIIGGFLVALMGQGVLSAVSPTNDTFGTGVAKVINQLSLGIIDVRGGGANLKEGMTEDLEKEGTIEISSEEKKSEVVPVEKSVDKPVEKSVENVGDDSKNDSGDSEKEAVFDGYVAESTDTRVKLSGAGLTVWRGDFRTALIGVGLGGAGQALYQNGLAAVPREIVQNEYVSLLLETGLVGIILLAVTVVLMVRAVLRNGVGGASVVLTLTVAYGVTLLFFSGLPNALQVYLLPVAVMVLLCNLPVDRFKLE